MPSAKIQGGEEQIQIQGGQPRADQFVRGGGTPIDIYYIQLHVFNS